MEPVDLFTQHLAAIYPPPSLPSRSLATLSRIDTHIEFFYDERALIYDVISKTCKEKACISAPVSVSKLILTGKSSPHPKWSVFFYGLASPTFTEWV